MPHHHRSANKFAYQVASGKATNAKPKKYTLKGTDNPAILHAPRLYQIELFEKAKAGNIIAVLETGAGKTLIAVMLLKHVLTNETRLRSLDDKRPKKLGIFLVNLVPLVIQQAQVIASNIPYSVTELCGEMGVDLWDKRRWDNIVKESDVLVMTAQILLNMLRHGYIGLDQIALFIFDECHHTRKNHPFNLIMTEFYFRKYTPLYDLEDRQNHSSSIVDENRPKIFSMTASPMGSQMSTIVAASNLEASLDSKIYTVTRKEELRAFVKRPREICMRYPSAPNYEKHWLIDYVSLNCSRSQTIQRLDKICSDVLNSLGPWCAMLVFRTFIQDPHTNLASGVLLERDSYSNDQFIVEEVYLEKARRIYLEFQRLIPKDEDPIFKNPLELDDWEVSPKAKTLIKVLYQGSNTLKNFCGIVFVQRRSIAYAIYLFIKRVTELDKIKAGFILGHNSSSGLNMSFKQQNKVIADFKSGKLNLMIATSVAEEGLDIQPCNLVVRFDSFNSLISYIQSRGRARSKRSHFVIMQEEGNQEEMSSLIQLQRAEGEMDKWCSTLPEDRFHQLHLENKFDENEDEDGLNESIVYEISSTGAFLTLESSVQKIYHYCSTLPHDGFCNMIPVFEVVHSNGYFQCALKLPSSCSITVAHGDLCKSKKLARQSAAYKMCIDLHKLGQLNDHLLPIEEEFDEQDFEPAYFENEKSIEGTWRAKRDYDYKIPDFWTVENEAKDQFFINAIDLSQLNLKFGQGTYRPFVIITRKPLPKFNPIEMFFKSKPSIITVLSSSQPIQIKPKSLTELYLFTLFSFKAIFNKEFECNLEECKYLFAPLKLQVNPLNKIDMTSIDWLAVKEIFCPPSYPDLNLSYKELLICDKTDHMKRYYINKIRYDINPTMQMDQPNRDESALTFEEYYKNQFNKIVTNMSQPILEVERVNLALNYLQRYSNKAKKVKGRNANYLLPEFTESYQLTASILRSTALLPSLMSRMDSLLLIKEVKANLDLEEVSDELLLEAFTLTSANVAMDYERLELLGDSFLKFVVSIVLYLNFPGKHEGQMHCRRIRMIGNRFLFKCCRDKELTKFITSRSFNRQRWRPPNFRVKNDSSDSMRMIYPMADKALADVIEATLAAGLLSGGEDLALRCARAVGIPLDPFTCWQDIVDFSSEPSPLSRSAMKQLLNINEIEEKIGYKFNHPELLVEAFTHASYPNPLTPCYQRLEFLGDAVLDYFVVSYLFHTYPSVSPGGLTEVKDACVSNNTLSAIMEKLNLHRHIIHFSGILMKSMEQFIITMEQLRKDSIYLETKEYWYDIKAPKVIADVLEALLGAIMVDTNFNVKETHKFFERLIKPVYDEHLEPGKVIVHPIIQITRFFHRNGCEFFNVKCYLNEEDEYDQNQNIPQLNPNEKVTCDISIHGNIISTAKGKVVKAARKYAAQSLLDRLALDPYFWKDQCNCTNPDINSDSEDDLVG